MLKNNALVLAIAAASVMPLWFHTFVAHNFLLRSAGVQPYIREGRPKSGARLNLKKKWGQVYEKKMGSGLDM